MHAHMYTHACHVCTWLSEKKKLQKSASTSLTWVLGNQIEVIWLRVSASRAISLVLQMGMP